MKTRESGMPEESMWHGFFEPETILKKLGLSSDCRDVVDFGCGYGTFTIPAARIVSGTVHALDIEPEMVERTRCKAEAAGLREVEVGHRDFVTDGSGLPDASVDYAMLFNILHAEERQALLDEAWRVLSDRGILAVIHWNYDPATPRGPSMDIRPSPEECRAWCETAGFECRPPGRIDLPPYHYGFVFQKQSIHAMTIFRQEHDLLGTLDVPADALWGIHTQRAIENFPIAGRPVHRRLVRAFGAVKLAAARTNHELGRWDAATMAAIESACAEMIDGRLDQHVVVDALQGGAGTSTNMNVNEVLANRALQILGRPLGDYQTLSPLDDLNRHQSTNDTYPTALRVAAIWGLRDLEAKVVALVEAFQRKEHELANVVAVARTQLQDAVLVTLGRQMGAYAEAFARDRWRIYKCEERLRVVNLGGTAIGTGLGAPRQYIFRVTEHLREITRLGLARAENLVEATANADAFVEVSGILRALGSNLLKTATDLRLLSSGPDAGLGEIRLPARQAGSSIMPGKINPVIPEAVSQAAIAAACHDQAIERAVSAGNLQLSQFLPLVADSLLTSLDLLTAACDVLARLCVDGIEADADMCRRHVAGSTASATALVEWLGYETASRLASIAASERKDLRQTAIDEGMLTGDEFDALVSPDHVMRLGSENGDCAKKLGKGGQRT